MRLYVVRVSGQPFGGGGRLVAVFAPGMRDNYRKKTAPPTGDHLLVAHAEFQRIVENVVPHRSIPPAEPDKSWIEGCDVRLLEVERRVQ